MICKQKASPTSKDNEGVMKMIMTLSRASAVCLSFPSDCGGVVFYAFRKYLHDFLMPG